MQRLRGRIPDADDMSVRLLLQMSFDHPGAVFPVGHHPTAQQTQPASEKVRVWGKTTAEPPLPDHCHTAVVKLLGEERTVLNSQSPVRANNSLSFK